MIKNIIELLNIDPFLSASKEVQIAKGINTLPKGLKGVREQVIRSKNLKNKK